MQTKFGIITLFFLFSYSNNVFATEKSIYGKDDRIDYYQASSWLQSLAQSTAAMIRKSKMYSIGNNFYIRSGTLQDRGICSSERFSDQMAAASCSGFLVGEDLLVTAGHCIENKKDCSNSYWVFDYRMESEDYMPKSVSNDAVFSCKKIIEQKLTRGLFKNDYALIRLDRKVNRRPLKVRRKGKVSKGDKLFVIGHPTGLPTKIALNGKVKGVLLNYFTANVDTFGGNSGSAVFNQDGIVEGILVRGKDDYEEINGCKKPNTFRQNALFSESVTHITNIKKLK